MSLPSFAQSFASPGIRHSAPSPPIETAIDPTPNESSNGSLARPTPPSTHQYTLPPIDHIDSRVTSRSSSRSPSSRPHHYQRHPPSAQTRVGRPYSNSVSSIDPPSSYLSRKRSHDVAIGMHADVPAFDEHPRHQTRMGSPSAAPPRSSTPAGRVHDAITAGSNSPGRHILDRAPPARRERRESESENIKAIPALVRVKEEEHEENSPRSRANSLASSGYHSPAAPGTSSGTRQQQPHGGGSQTHAPSPLREHEGPAAPGGDVMFRASAGAGLTSSLPKKRRVTVSGDAPSALRYSGSNAPLIPMPLRGLQPTASSEAVEHLQLAVRLKAQQKQLIQARRSGKSVSSVVTPEPFALPSSLSSPSFAAPANVVTSHHGAGARSSRPHRPSDPSGGATTTTVASPVSPWGDSSDRPQSFSSFSTVPHEHEHDRDRDNDVRSRNSSSPSRSPESPLYARSPRSHPYAAGRYRKSRHQSLVAGMLASGPPGVSAGGGMAPPTHEPSSSTVEAALDLEMEVEDDEGLPSDETQDAAATAAVVAAHGRGRTQSSLLPTSSAPDLRGSSLLPRTNSGSSSPTPTSGPAYLSQPRGAGRHATHSGYANPPTRPPYAQGHARDHGGREPVHSARGRGEAPGHLTVHTVNVGTNPSNATSSGTGGPNPSSATPTPTLAEMERSLVKQSQTHQAQHQLRMYEGAPQPASLPHGPPPYERSRDRTPLADHGSGRAHPPTSESSMATFRRPPESYGHSATPTAEGGYYPPPSDPHYPPHHSQIPPHSHSNTHTQHRDHRELPSLHTLQPAFHRRDSVSTRPDVAPGESSRGPPSPTVSPIRQNHRSSHSHYTPYPPPHHRASVPQTDAILQAPAVIHPAHRESLQSAGGVATIDQIIDRGRFVSIFEGMYDTMMDARRVSAWIEEQRSLRATDPGVVHPPEEQQPLSTLGEHGPETSTSPSRGTYVRVEDLNAIIDTRVQAALLQRQGELERLENRIRELELRVAPDAGVAPATPDILAEPRNGNTHPPPSSTIDAPRDILVSGKTGSTFPTPAVAATRVAPGSAEEGSVPEPGPSSADRFDAPVSPGEPKLGRMSGSASPIVPATARSPHGESERTKHHEVSDDSASMEVDVQAATDNDILPD
ncbi:hypothetical protein DL93DRAFT_400779 [Clavulina sp. PMI_390]|nr:hypothetical protein DL93DRAFT_400779 [Clavulina sp. PMI_390]